MKYIDFLKSNKYIVIMFLVGVFLMVISRIYPYNVVKIDENTHYSVSENLEEEIAHIIQKTYNLENTYVIVTYDTLGEKVLEYNYEQSVSGTDNNSMKTFQKSSVPDKDTKQPFVKAEKLPFVRGALVSVSPVDTDTAYDIQVAVATLLGVSVNKVNVICERN